MRSGALIIPVDRRAVVIHYHASIITVSSVLRISITAIYYLLILRLGRDLRLLLIGGRALSILNLLSLFAYHYIIAQ